MAKHRKAPINESSIVKACLYVLAMRRIWAERVNTGAMVTTDGRYVQFGTKGRADISGLLPTGIRLEVECKSAKGIQSEHQKKFQDIIERNNGIYWLVRSPQELLNKLIEKGY